MRRIFFFPMFELKKLGGNISRCDEKGFRWGPYFLFLWVCFWLQKAALKKQHWATVSSPLWSRIVNSTRTNFSSHWKKCSFLLQVCFWIEAALAFRIYWTGFLLLWFCFCLKATLENVVPVGVFFWAWSSTGTEKISGWAGEKFAGWKKNGRTAGENIWEFRTTDIKVRRFGHMRICDWEVVRVWRWENLQVGRGENFILKENERVRPREEVKVFGQEYT